jgi:nitrogen fixation protein FixH
MTRQRTGFALSGRHVLIVFIGFFLIVFAVNGLMVYQAESTFGGLDTDDAYRKGLAYNDRIAAAATQSRLGWHDRTDYVAEVRRLRVTLSDATGAGISGLKVSAVIERPATDVFDRQLSLSQTGPDTYEADVSQLEPGAWTVDLQARRDGEGAALYEARRRLWIKP